MAKKSKIRKELVWGGFIIFLMISSVFGVMFYGFSSPSTKLIYNDYKFTITQQGFMTKIDGQKYLFSFYPADLEYINASPGIVDMIKGKSMVFLTYSQQQSNLEYIAAAEFELQQALSSLGVYAPNALGEENEYNIPVVTCMNATPFVPVIDFREGDKTELLLEDGCIIGTASHPEEFIRLKERITLTYLGIME